MLKRESGVRKVMGSYRTYYIPRKTAALVPEFAVDDLPSAELQPRSCVGIKGPALGQKTMMVTQTYTLTYIVFVTC